MRGQQHAKTEARGDRMMQLMLAAIADAVPLLKEGSRNMVVSCGVQGEIRTAVALLPSPSLLLSWYCWRG
ncbi:mycofactocin biosynthesis peptidyl-dipeptidase MftE [Sesbania bispinosa]|nr:mycofactocin biosynthesis peptidyl-dipeptidase MftE [Sesbania bispinosa]